MKWNFLHNTTDKILVVSTEGILDLPSANEMRDEGMKLIRQHGYLLCMLDHSKTEGFEINVFDTYDLPKKYKELNIPPSFRMAVVVPEERRENSHFYETVCRNNGYSVSVFFERESALQWLKGC